MSRLTAGHRKRRYFGTCTCFPRRYDIFCKFRRVTIRSPCSHVLGEKHVGSSFAVVREGWEGCLSSVNLVVVGFERVRDATNLRVFIETMSPARVH